MVPGLKRRREASSSAASKRGQPFELLYWAFLLPAYGRRHACRGAFADRVKADCGFTLWAQGRQLAASRWHMICSVKGCSARVVYRKEENGGGIYLIAENAGHTHEVRQPPTPPVAPEPAPPTASEPNPTQEPEPVKVKTRHLPEPSKDSPATASEARTSYPETPVSSEEHEGDDPVDGPAADQVCAHQSDEDTRTQIGSPDPPTLF